MPGSKSAQKKKIVRKTESSGSKAASNPCCVYDFTLFDEISVREVRDFLNEMCKKYCFQLEQGEKKGKFHYQGRFSLKMKKRKTELIKMLSVKWNSFHISVTSTENRDNNFYVTKEETRVEGPFTEENDIYVPKDIRNIKELRPWQNDIRTMLQDYNERTVDVIFDNKGNIGKTTLVRYMMIHDDAEMLPFCNDYKDIMRMAFDVGPKKVYLVDMPRAINKEKLFHFFSGVETLKSGYCYDDRYKFTRRLFDRPRICVFTNVKPDLALLSKDMWKLWMIRDDQLVDYEDESEEEEQKRPIIADNLEDLEPEYKKKQRVRVTRV